MRTSGKAALWRERFRRYERADVTVAEFCRREGVSVPSFYQWRKRLAQSSANERSKRTVQRRTVAPAHLPGTAREHVPAFQQVVLSHGGVVAIELPSGVRVELPADQLPLVRAVMADLLQAPTNRPAGVV